MSKEEQEMRSIIPKTVVLAGGPGGGKSRAEEAVSSRLSSRGVRAVFIPEAASILLGHGASAAEIKNTPEGGILLQREIVKLQLQLEESAYALARAQTADSIVFIADRGLLDGSAYIGLPAFLREVLAPLELSLRELKNRYYAVFHMVTSALGAEDHYNLANAARIETIEEARALDMRIQNAWGFHPRHVVIPNVDAAGQARGFDEKLKHLCVEIQSALGL